MSIPEHEKLTIAQFLEAIQGREGRYELVNGIAYAMAGAREGHNVICTNVLVSLAPAGKKSGCRTTSSDTGVRTGSNSIRYPDVVVDCGPSNATASMASKPTIIIEVSSPTTSVFDYGAKLREYQRLDSIDTILQIESEFAVVAVYRRQTDGTWTDELIESFNVEIPLPSLATSLTLNEIYDTLDVRPRIRLQIVEADAPPVRTE